MIKVYKFKFDNYLSYLSVIKSNKNRHLKFQLLGGLFTDTHSGRGWQHSRH